MSDGAKNHDGMDRIVQLKARTVNPHAQVPIAYEGSIDRNTTRLNKKISMRTFPVVCANARTVHKLQGRSIKKMVVSSWDYRGNWIYVCLSRCRTLEGLYLRIPLDRHKCKPMSEDLRSFLEHFRQHKQPPERVEIRR